MEEQARWVNLSEIRSRGGQRGNPLADGQNSSWVAMLTVDKTLGSSLTVLWSCCKTGASLRECMGSLTTGSPIGSLSTFWESRLNVQSGHNKDSQGQSCSP